MNNLQLKLLKSRFRYYFYRNWWSFIIFLSFIAIIVITIFLIVKNWNNWEKILFITIAFLPILMTFTIYLFQLELRLVPTLNQVQYIENQFPPSRFFFKLLLYFFVSAFLYDLLSQKFHCKVDKPILFDKLKNFTKITDLSKEKVKFRFFWLKKILLLIKKHDVNYKNIYHNIRMLYQGYAIHKQFNFFEKKLRAEKLNSVYFKYLYQIFLIKKTIYENNVLLNHQEKKILKFFINNLDKMNIFPKNSHTDLFYTSISNEIFEIANNINKYHNKKIKNQIKESYKLFQKNINLLVNKGEEFPAPCGSNLIKEFCDNEKKLVIIWQ